MPTIEFIRTYKFRLYPTPEQQAQIDSTINACRYIYNLALEAKIYAYKAYGKTLNRIGDLQPELPLMKKMPEGEWLSEVDSNCLVDALIQLEKSYANFFRRIKQGAEEPGFPRFKKKGMSGGHYVPASKMKIEYKSGFVSIPKNKNIPCVFHRPISGKLCDARIKRTSTGKYYITIPVKVMRSVCANISQGKIGIDLGVSSLVTLSNGEKYDMPRFVKESEKRLAVMQKQLSRKKKGSSNWKKQQHLIATLHEKTSFRRNEVIHNVTSQIVSIPEIKEIWVEDLNVKGMTASSKGDMENPGKKVKQKSGLNKAILNNAFSSFLFALEYKAQQKGIEVKKVPRFYASSKTCSKCGMKNEHLTLKDRIFTCDTCGFTMDRDLNAAINIVNYSSLEA